MGDIIPLSVLATLVTINVGDKVRSYDFPDDSRADARGCYIEGVVEAIGLFEFDNRSCERYRIRVTDRKWLGKTEYVTERHVYPPVNGTPIAGRPGQVTFSVVKID